MNGQWSPWEASVVHTLLFTVWKALTFGVSGKTAGGTFATCVNTTIDEMS